jgi:hypothetical protein
MLHENKYEFEGFEAQKSIKSINGMGNVEGRCVLWCARARF